MDDQPGAYAPQSPDLSGFGAPSSYSNGNNDPNSDTSYTLPPTVEQSYHPKVMRQDSFSLPESSYYQPPPSLQQQSSSYGFPAYAPRTQDLQFSSPIDTKRLKLDPDQDQWSPYSGQAQFQHSMFSADTETMPPTPIQQGETRRGRPPNSSGKKQSKSSAMPTVKSEQIPPEPITPAPGEQEGVVVKTKFPVARIKRIVQADDEVGKVAQATPVAVGKALELFMIHLTLASAEVATGTPFGQGGGGAGSKRLTRQHVKAAILKHDEFDFLRPIAEKIPDGPAGKGGDSAKGGRPKADSDEDGFDDSFDDDHSYGSRSKKKGAGRRA